MPGRVKIMDKIVHYKNNISMLLRISYVKVNINRRKLDKLFRTDVVYVKKSKTIFIRIYPEFNLSDFKVDVDNHSKYVLTY